MASFPRHLFSACLILGLFCSAFSEDPYLFFTWNVTWGTVSPLGFPQKAILINGEFPGPNISSVSNNNIVVNVYNNLDEPFLFTWSGVQQRKNSWQDGVEGTNCPIPVGQNFTYKFQVKDQIGSFSYYPSLGYQKAAGGYGGFHISSRDLIPVPFPPPDNETTIVIGDWYKANQTKLRKRLDRSKKPMWNPDTLLINGKASGNYSLTVEEGKTYRLRISNVGTASSFNFRIQGHKLKLVEVEGTHTVQNDYDSLDIHLGQTYSVLITANQPPKDYYIVASTRFADFNLTSTAVLHYANAQGGLEGEIPEAPQGGVEWSINQAKSIRTNLTASAARPNPQGSYKYGNVTITRTLVLENTAETIGKKKHFALNGVSFHMGDTPLKLADYYNVSGVFELGKIPDTPDGKPARIDTSVIDAVYRNFIEIVFQNPEDAMQSYHLDGYSFFVAGFGAGKWSNDSRSSYNLFDAVSRCTTQVYPNSWTAILLSIDNAGMWNLRSENWARRYLGQQLYLRSKSPVRTTRDEYEIPANCLLCGKLAGRNATIPPAAQNSTV